MQRNVPQSEIHNKWIPKYNEEDRPAKLYDQLKWLEQIGFSGAEVVRKYYYFAVYGAYKK